MQLLLRPPLCTIAGSIWQHINRKCGQASMKAGFAASGSPYPTTALVWAGYSKAAALLIEVPLVKTQQACKTCKAGVKPRPKPVHKHLYFLYKPIWFCWFYTPVQRFWPWFHSGFAGFTRLSCFDGQSPYPIAAVSKQPAHTRFLVECGRLRAAKPCTDAWPRFRSGAFNLFQQLCTVRSERKLRIHCSATLSHVLAPE